MVESQPSKLLVAGSSPVSRSHSIVAASGSSSYCVYILSSEKDGSFYVGSTEHLEERVAFHNSPRARWTKRHQPWKLIHVEEFETRGDAVRREKYLKSLKGIGKHLDDILQGKR